MARGLSLTCSFIYRVLSTWLRLRAGSWQLAIGKKSSKKNAGATASRPGHVAIKGALAAGDTVAVSDCEKRQPRLTMSAS